MKRELRTISVTELNPDPNQPRKSFSEEYLLALGENIRQNGQQVPMIAYRDVSGLVLADGECRLRALKLTKQESALVLILPEKPTPATLTLIQLSVDLHRSNLNPIELAFAYQKLYY